MRARVAPASSVAHVLELRQIARELAEGRNASSSRWAAALA